MLVQRLPDQINVAGMNSGTALAWSPAWPDRLVQADDHPRLTIRSFGETAERREASGPISSTVMDIVVTPDERRLLWVDRDGHLVSFDARHELPMVELDSSLKEVSGMSIDRRGQRLAIVNDEGTVEIWQTSAQAKSTIPEPPDASAAWTATDWLNRHSAVTLIEPRTLRFDTQGRAHFLAVETHPKDFRNYGALYHVVEDGPAVTREQITVGNPGFDNRMDGQACALHLHHDTPLVVFRCRTAEMSPYDGAFYSTRRTKPGVWEQAEKIHEHGNLGFYPAMLVNAEGGSRMSFTSRSADSTCSTVHGMRTAGSRSRLVSRETDTFGMPQLPGTHSRLSRMSIDSTPIPWTACSCAGNGGTPKRCGNVCLTPLATRIKLPGFRMVNQWCCSSAAMRTVPPDC